MGDDTYTNIEGRLSLPGGWAVRRFQEKENLYRVNRWVVLGPDGTTHVFGIHDAPRTAIDAILCAGQLRRTDD